jgi:hypothetical protein
VDLQTFEAMLAPNSQQLLARIEPEYDGDNALTVSARFRRADRSLVAACPTQTDLRRRPVSKSAPTRC